jgi:Acetyltransferase (GNAT) domain
MQSPDAPLSKSDREDLVANIHGFYSTWALRFPSGQVLPEPGLSLIDSGVGTDELNIAFVEQERDAADTVRRAARFFGGRLRPWRLEGPVALAGPLESVAREVDLPTKHLRPVLMVTPAELKRTASPPDLKVKVAESAEEVSVFQRTLAEGMSGIHHLDLPTPIRPSSPEMTCYVGFVGGNPVATAVLYTHRRLAGIYAVATVNQARRRGYGRALTQRAAEDGFHAGCPLSFLQASEMGRPVYLAMGYRWQFDRVCWTPAE